MNSWLFQKYNEKAWGIFRICFYLTIFYFYDRISGLYYLNWLNPEFQAYFAPVSFFSFFSFQDFQFLGDLDILNFWKVSLIFCALGIAFPISSFVSFLGILIMAGIPLNFGKIHHVNHMPVVVMGILAFNFFPGAYSVDNFIRRKFTKISAPLYTTWALRTCQVYMCIVYFASGLQKMKNTGLSWIFSDNMQHIILTRPTVTELGLWIAQYPLLCKGMALVTVLAQLGAPLALISWRLRLFIIPTLFMLHVGTYLVLGNHGYFFPYNLCFLVWIPWDKLPLLKDKILVGGVKFFIFFPSFGAFVQRVYILLLFPLISGILKLKHGSGFQLVLRHSILKKKFNPFLSDIDYSLVIDNGFQKLDELTHDLICLNGLKIFDLPQIYLKDEWRILDSFSDETKERIWFIWNVRKYGWLNSKPISSEYESIKKNFAIQNCESLNGKIISGEICSVKDFGFRKSVGPQLCLYIPYLEIKDKTRIMICDLDELNHLVSLLPGEVPEASLDQDSFDFKRALWISEYLLSRSHLRLNTRRGEDCGHFKEWLRFLEEKYELIFQEKIVASGSNLDLEKSTKGQT